MAFITDSAQNGPNGIIVVDLASGESGVDSMIMHRLNLRISEPSSIVEGRPFIITARWIMEAECSYGVDGIAINSDGSGLYYCGLCSRNLFSIATDALANRNISEQEVPTTISNHGDRGGASDGLESDSSGNLYSTNYEHNAILRLRHSDSIWETLVCDPRLLWPDTLALANDGYLYVTANQLHRQARFNKGKDLRVRPYTLFRILRCSTSLITLIFGHINNDLDDTVGKTTNISNLFMHRCNLAR